MSRKTQRRHQTYKHPQYMEPKPVRPRMGFDNHGPSAVSKALPIIAKTQHFEQYWQDRILRAGRSEENNE